MIIKQLKGTDVDKAFVLALKVFKKNVNYNHFGLEKFKYNVIYNERYRKSCKKGINILFGCFYETKLIGVIGISKNGFYITLLFVKDEYQRKKIGTSLFNYAIGFIKDTYETKEIIINATQNALPFYESLGCEVTGEKEEKDGVIITPMKCIIKE